MSLETLAPLGWQVFWWLMSLGVAAGIVFGIPWLRAKAKQDEVKAKTAGHESVWYWLVTASDRGVLAAQQFLDANPEKKQFAIAFVKMFLFSRGIELPLDVMSASVEASVADLKKLQASQQVIEKSVVTGTGNTVVATVETTSVPVSPVQQP